MRSDIFFYPFCQVSHQPFLLYSREVIDIADYGLSANLSQTSFSANGGYRQSLNTFFPDLAFGMYVQGLVNYSFGTVTFDISSGTFIDLSTGESFTIEEEEEFDSSSWGLGGGFGTSFVVQNFDVNVGADVLFEKVTLTYDDEDFEADQWKPKFKIHVGLQF